MRKFTTLAARLLLGSAAFLGLGLANTATAADHGDAPNVDNDSGADIADVFAFLDPNDNTRVVIIGTVHGFIVPGEAGNFASFDPNVEYRFDLEQTGDGKADQSIVVRFSERTNATDPPTASVTLPGSNKVSFTAPTTPANLSATATPQKITTDAATGVKFFAGEADDPFFFDIPAFQRFVASVKAGNPDASVFSRGRDSFAGYNVLGIAMSFPADIVKGGRKTKILGVDFVTSRRTQTSDGKAGTGGVNATGKFPQADRMAHPALNAPP